LNRHDFAPVSPNHAQTPTLRKGRERHLVARDDAPKTVHQDRSTDIMGL
jgi:hypothetical protein